MVEPDSFLQGGRVDAKGGVGELDDASIDGSGQSQRCGFNRNAIPLLCVGYGDLERRIKILQRLGPKMEGGQEGDLFVPDPGEGDVGMRSSHVPPIKSFREGLRGERDRCRLNT